jgi:hypothetical protein
MRRARQGRLRLARLFFRKRWLFRGKRSFSLAICLRSDPIPWNRCRKRRFRLNSHKLREFRAVQHSERWAICLHPSPGCPSAFFCWRALQAAGKLRVSGGSTTIVTYTFNGNNMPVTVATQIGTGAYTQATLTSGTLTISIPDGETNYSVAFLCPSPTVGPFVNEEYINQASTLDGTAFSETCPPNPYLGRPATIQVNAAAIPGAEGISVGS